MALTEIPSELSSTPSIVDNGNATAITIGSDESVALGGNFIVGATSAFASSSFCVDPTGLGQFRRDGTPLLVRRDGSIGDLISFEDDGATVGSIGTIAGYMTAGTSDTGVLFHSGEDSVQPWNVSTNAGRDNAINLGASNARFKEIYLSRGVNFSSNANAGGMTSETLDDYEEGNFQPTIIAATGNQPTITYTHNTGTYTKVGRLVTLVVYFQIAAISGTTTGNLNITGLPFTQLSGNGYASCGAFSCNGMNFARTAFGSVTQYQTPTLGFLTQNNNTAWSWESVNILSAGDAFRFTISYHTTA